MRRSSILLSAIIIVLYSCGGDRIIYDQSELIPEAGWTYADTASFDFEVTDTNQIYRLLVYFNYSKEYDWENLYTRITTHFPGDSLNRQVVSFEFAGPTGNWYGDCGRKTCELVIPLQNRVRFPETGYYRLAFEQYMRDDTVQGIQSLGLRLVRPSS